MLGSYQVGSFLFIYRRTKILKLDMEIVDFDFPARFEFCYTL